MPPSILQCKHWAPYNDVRIVVTASALQLLSSTVAIPLQLQCKHMPYSLQSKLNSKKTLQSKQYDCCVHRARLKQRLEAAQEGVSTEDGSSSVTSGLDEDQAAQADMMMRRLVWVHIS